MRWRIIFIVIVLIFSGGIANYKELNDLAIVSSIGIDKMENGNYKVSVQVMNTKKGGSSSGESSGSDSQITVYENEDKTIQSALRTIINESPKKLYLAHMQLLVISEEIAREGINDSLDFFLRNTDTNPELLILIANEENKAIDILSTLTPVEMNPTTNLLDSLEETYKYEATAMYDSSLYEIVDKIMCSYRNPLITSVKLIGDKEEAKSPENIEAASAKSKLVISNVAYFYNDKMIGYLEKDEVKVANMIANRFKNTIIQTQVNSAMAAYEIIESKTKMETKMNDNSFDIEISIDIKANLSEIAEEYEIKNSENLKYLEDCLKSKVTEMVNNYLYSIKNKYKIDLCGFGDMLYKKYGKKFSENSEGYLDRLNFKVNVNVNLENEGSVLSQW